MDFTKAQTATQMISNDIALYNLGQRKLEEEKVGVIDRENRSLQAQHTLKKQQETQAYMTSPAGQIALQKTAEAGALVEMNQAVLGLKQSEAALANQDVAQQTQYADLQTQNIEALNQRDKVTKRQNVNRMLEAAKSADLIGMSQGNPYPTRTVELLDALSKSDYGAFTAAADVIAPMLSDIEQQHGLPPTLKSQIDDIKKSAVYSANGNVIKSTLSGLSQARQQGTLTPTAGRILNSTAEVGIDINDETDKLNLIVQQEGGNYTLVNALTGQKSQSFTSDEFNNTPELQSLYVASQKRQRNAVNNLTKTDIYQAQLKAIEENPLVPEVGQAFKNVINNLAPEIADVPGYTTRVAGTMSEFQRNAIAFNPMIGPEGDTLLQELKIDDDAISRGLGSLRTELFGGGELGRFDAKVQANPGFAQQVVNAYANRETGGMPKAVFDSTVNKIVQQTIAADPRYQVSPTNPPEAVKQLTDMLKTKVQRSLVVPRTDAALTVAYNRVVDLYPNLAISSTAKLDTPGGMLRKIRTALLGQDLSQPNPVKAVADGN
jgi:hypothetical protein